MDRKPVWQQHYLDRHHGNRPPAHDAEQRQQYPCEDVALRRAAVFADRLARSAHVRRLRVVANHLQREIRLDAGAHIEVAAVEQRPAIVRGLDAA